MDKRKGVTAIEFLIYLLIGIFTMVVLFFIIPSLLGKSNAQTSNLISSSGDFDNDGVTNFFDKCKCDPAITQEFHGCPSLAAQTSPPTPPADCEKRMRDAAAAAAAATTPPR